MSSMQMKREKAPCGAQVNIFKMSLKRSHSGFKIFECFDKHAKSAGLQGCKSFFGGVKQLQVRRDCGWTRVRLQRTFSPLPDAPRLHPLPPGRSIPGHAKSRICSRRDLLDQTGYSQSKTKLVILRNQVIPRGQAKAIFIRRTCA